MILSVSFDFTFYYLLWINSFKLHVDPRSTDAKDPIKQKKEMPAAALIAIILAGVVFFITIATLIFCIGMTLLTVITWLLEATTSGGTCHGGIRPVRLGDRGGPLRQVHPVLSM